ncbi:toll-like receptor 13 [Gopherus flavomarginatus]|uniref:toll-like receptor 13 n=1 Tax=Gopherus flavomarginatus TaxID=286002 RepID=UPI0021CBEE48|nr:toll-like receptor 13 [Gopherus flavomarginatus]
MLFLQLFSALIFFSQGQGVAPYSLQNCVVHGKWSKMIKVLCYHQNLSQVPCHLPWNVSSLDLSENRIASLRQSDFSKLSLLQFLNVSQNQIHLIEGGTFTHTSSLKILNLTSNQLRVLSSSMFDGLGNLTILLLRKNNIDRIEPSAFAHLMKLKVIDLSSNKLHSLNALDVVFKVKSLEELHIRENNITNFTTKDIVNVPMWLRELDASHNPNSFIDVATDALYRLLSLDLSFSGTYSHITWIIQDPCFLKGLKRLYLGGIFMTSLDILAVVQKLNCSLLEEIHLNELNLTDSDKLIEKVCLWHRNVKTLNLQGNKFESIKGIVFENCTHLWHLDLSHNRLKVVPCISFQPLNSLQSLSLANNEFTAVPDATSNIMSLKSLDLSFNQIRKIVPNDFANLKNLEHLTLTGNRITTISSDLFRDLHNLLELNLGMNLLLEISRPFSDSLGKLEKMELVGNKMSSIKKETFRNLTSLQFLSLLDNQISTIEPGAFEGLRQLQTLLLGTNKITKETLQKGIFQGVNSLVDLQLFENYISYETSGALDNPPFILLKSLKYLSLNSQRDKGLLNFPSNFLQGLESIVRIHAGNLPITDLDPATFSYTPMLQELDLSSNPINPISPALLQPGPKLRELHLNTIGLQSLDFVLHVNFSNLAILRVSGNKLNVIELKHIRALPYLTFLDLRQNPFTCSCDNQMFLSWSLHDLKTQVLYFYQYTCAFPLASKGRKLWAFHTSSCTVNHEFILFVTNTSTIILLMIVCICFRWRWQGIYAYHLLLAYVHDKRYKRMRQHTKYDYDAFVSYNTHDREWVINELLPTLEDKYHWRLCLHYRDFEPGKCILKNIVENIYASRKTICVITHQYLESEWCSKEIQVASFRLFDEHKDVLILIFLEHIPSDSLSSYHRMRKLVKKKTYLMWPQEKMEIPLFWHKLNMALKTSEGKDDEDPILSGIIPDED